MRSSVAAVLMACLALMLTAGPAGAATQLGETFVPTDNCSPRTRLQTGAAAPAYTAPAAGVITAWSFQSSSAGGSGPVRLKIVRRAGGDNFTTVGHSSFETIPDEDALHVFAARIPMQTGDLIGLHAQPASVFYCARPALGFDIHQGAFGVDQEVGTTEAFTLATDVQIGVAAQLEADADGDGFGDETQDACPTDAALQTPCPDVDPPETTLTKDAPRNLSKSKAKFAFVADEAGATFECKLDRKRWKPCASPRRVKRLRMGKHRFHVRATDLAGNVDASPARDRFRVVG